MALLKNIELDNGIILNYHRIVTITKITNHSIVLEIAGYTSKLKREQEIQQWENGETITAYIDTTFMSVDYDEKTTIKDWYDYLKTTEKYSGAEDDEEEQQADSASENMPEDASDGNTKSDTETEGTDMGEDTNIVTE